MGQHTIFVFFLAMAGVRASPVAEPNRTVLPANEAKRVFGQCSRHSPGYGGQYWVPSSVDLDLMETRLTEYLRHNGHTDLAQRFSTTFLRQYVGLSREGRRFIYLNALRAETVAEQQRSCTESRSRSKQEWCAADYWRTHAVVMCDGGDWYWGVLYQVDTGEFSMLAFNGEA